MDKERQNATDITTLAEATGEWRANTIESLPQPLQEMTRNIERWFNVLQEWHFTTHGDKVRIARSSKVPGLYTVRFYYDATNPPIAKRSLFSGCDSIPAGWLDLPKVFSSNLRREQVYFWSTSEAGIRGIENIGPVEQWLLGGILVGVDYSDERWWNRQHTHAMRLVVKVNIRPQVSTG